MQGLSVNKGTQIVGLDELKHIPLPAPTPTYTPVAVILIIILAFLYAEYV